LNHVALLVVELLAAIVWALISFRCIERPILSALRGPRTVAVAPIDPTFLFAVAGRPALRRS
jgi:peptidoglycan/LPS O-acetylase OafA/YrhL